VVSAARTTIKSKSPYVKKIELTFCRALFLTPTVQTGSGGHITAEIHLRTSGEILELQDV
jgi:hypothetical protein